MNENDHRNQIYNNYIIYTSNTNIVKTFRLLKFIYICMIISTISVVFLYDDHLYSSNILETTYAYLLIELCSLLIFSLKIRNIKYSRIWRSIGFVTRILWIIFTFCAVIDLLSETKTTDSPLYYLLWYVYGSNIFYLIISSYICCILYMCFSSTYSAYQRRAIISIIDDNTDIHLFSNVLKIPGLYNDTMCSICYENFCNDDTVKILSCKHYYHTICIDKWLTDHNQCPICRTNVYTVKFY